MNISLMDEVISRVDVEGKGGSAGYMEKKELRGERGYQLMVRRAFESKLLAIQAGA